ncbi:MAG: phosphate ABC transporter substrate-binding protein PstS [Acidimicrobiales bacterium]|jgi:phosphate transport system substrate-binding protein
MPADKADTYDQDCTEVTTHMKMNRTVRLAIGTTAVVLSAISLVAVSLLPNAGATTRAKSDPYLAADTRVNAAATIGGAGSTFAAPLENAAQTLYTSRSQNATINGYQAVGSGTGEADIIKKLVDWGGTDVPMLQRDINKNQPSGANYTLSDFLQIPIGLGGVAIAFNVPSLKVKTLNLTAAVLANIYLGKISYWNAYSIQVLNKKVKLPHSKIIVVARGDSSGTTYIYTNFLHAAAPSVWTTLASKTPLALPTDGIAGNGNAGVASDIENTPNSIGYVEYSYLLLNPGLLKGVAAVINKAGNAIQPTTAGIALAAASKPKISSTAFSIVWAPGQKTYPIAGYTWAVIWKNQTTSLAEGTLLVKYLDWLSHSGAADGVTAGQDVAALQGYVPLPANVQALARTTLLQCTYNGKALLTTNGW